jgi:hypothetical protein
MTAQWYVSFLAPGMIADYGLEGSFGRDIALWKWLDTHFTGPFGYSGSSTAHWTQHICVSNEADEKMLLACVPTAKLYTEGFGSQGMIPQRSLSVAEWTTLPHPNLNVYFGQASQLYIAEYLAKYPIPISPVSTVIANIHLDDERDRYLKQRNKFWQNLLDVKDLPHHVHLERGDPVAIENWLTDNIRGTFSVIRKTDNFGMSDIKSDCQIIVAFSDKAEAAKFKLFWHD